MARPVVKVRDLEKSFLIARPLWRQLVCPFGPSRRIRALSAVCFRVEPGEILGVVGRNGAGKTTLLRILADLLEADGGEVELCGRKFGRRSSSVRGEIGYVSSDERGFFWRLTGRQNLEFFARLYGLSREELRQRTESLLDIFGLRAKGEELFGDYSTGTRKKFAVVRSLVHEPRVVLLDEVTNSLDPASARSIKAMVREYVSKGQGRAAVWSTHRLEEISEICDKVLVIERGSVRFFGVVGEAPGNWAVQADSLKAG